MIFGGLLRHMRMELTGDEQRPRRTFVPIQPGVEVCVLRRHSGPGLTYLLRISERGISPIHGHPGGEEVYLLEGRLRIWNRTDPDGRPANDVVISAGEYFHAPPGETHGAVAEQAALLFVVAPGGLGP